MGQTAGALSGIKVLDLTDERAIYGAKLLADLGADVVRPERQGDAGLRARGPFSAGGQSLWYAFFASNRRFLTLDGPQDETARQLAELLARADIALVTDARFAGIPLDLSAARTANPKLLVVDTTSFGDTGPWADFQAPDLIAGALGGAMATTGDASTPPLKGFGELNFMVSGAYVAIAALSGWYAAHRRGQGQVARISVHESLVSTLEQVLMFYWYCERLNRPDTQVLPRQGSTHWSNAYTVMQGRNGNIMVTPTPDIDKQLAWLIEEDAHEDLIDPKYAEPENLPLLIGRMMELLRKWVATKDVEALFHEAQSRHIPYGWVQPIGRVRDNPQLQARDWFVDYMLETESTSGPGAPYRFSRTPWRMEAPVQLQNLDEVGWSERPTARAGAKQGADAADDRPLAGVRILDFTHVLAGPFATRVLGDLGADVIKVNSSSRATGANEPIHPYYLMWNRNKRALSLNMGDEQARQVCRALCEQADVVIDNFSVGVLDRWGVGYDAVAEVNPGVVYVQMSGMGEGGPWSNFVTYAPTIHALCGLTQLTGVPGREDIGIGFSYNDHQAGLHGAVAILAALAERERSGRGQRVDVSQFEVGVNFAGPALLDLFANDRAAEPVGNRLPYDEAAPHNVYRCAPADAEDIAQQRWLAIACMHDGQWQALCELMGQPPWCRDPALETASGRVAAAQMLDEHLAAWTRDQDAYELMQRLQQAGVPAGVVQDGADLQTRDPQLNGFFEKLTDVHPELGQTWVDHLPIRFDETPCEQYERVRALGEDNARVLADWLGYDGQRTEQLRAAGALD